MGGKKVSGRGKKSLQGRATPLPLMVITVLSPSVFHRTATRGETKKKVETMESIHSSAVAHTSQPPYIQRIREDIN